MSDPMTARSVMVPPSTWAALKLLTSVTGRSVGAEVRMAVDAHLLRYGLVVQDGEVVPTAATWDAVLAALKESKAEEGIQEGGESRGHGTV